jgi:hypothetical protein
MQAMWQEDEALLSFFVDSRWEDEKSRRNMLETHTHTRSLLNSAVQLELKPCDGDRRHKLGGRTLLLGSFGFTLGG